MHLQHGEHTKMGLKGSFRGPTHNYLLERGEHKYSFESTLFHFKAEIHAKTGLNGALDTRHRPDTDPSQTRLKPDSDRTYKFSTLSLEDGLQVVA